MCRVRNLTGKIIVLTLVMLLLGVIQKVEAGSGHSNGTIIHTPIKHVPEGEPIVIETEFMGSITRASVYFRLPGEPAFMETQMTQKMNGKYSARLQVKPLKKGDVVEYYITAETGDGNVITYPENYAEIRPLEVVVSERSVVQETGIEANVLSPESGTKVNQKDFLLAISLFSDNPVEVKNLKVVLDGDNDVTKKSDVTAELITYSSKDLKKGLHTARLWYTLASGDKVTLAELGFEIASEGGEDILSGKGFTQATGAGKQAGPTQASFNEDGQFTANFRTEYKSQSNLGTKTNYGRVGADLGYEKKWFQLGATFDFDSEDDFHKNQPLNRYLITGNFDNLLIVNYGDTYPTFSPVTLYGTRVRGISTGIYLGIFNLEFVSGELNRKVISKEDQSNLNLLKGILGSATATDSSLTVLNAITRASDSINAGRAFTGTFKRQLTGGRFSIGPQAFQIGISAAHTKDDEGSLYNKNGLVGQLGFQGVRPQENMVAGVDFKTSLFAKRFNLDASIATSLSNTDISGGSLDEADFTAVGFTLKQNKIDLLSKFMTINANLTPITSKLDKNLFAYTAGGSLNAFEQNLTVRYRSNGGYFQSFAASTQRDIQTFEIADRVRLMQNRVFLTGMFSTSKNNLSKTNTNTLDSKTIGFNASLFLPKLPTLTVGFTTVNRDNNFDYFGGLLVDSNKQIAGNARPEANTTNIISVGTTYGFNAMSFRNNASLTFSNSKKTDDSKPINALTQPLLTNASYYTPLGAASINTFGLSLTSEWRIPLRTAVNFSTSTGKTLGLDTLSVKQTLKSTVSTFGASGDYQLLNKKELKMNVYGGISFSTVDIPNTNKASLKTINLGERMNFFKKHSLTLNMNLTSGLKIPVFSTTTGLQTGTKDVTNTVVTARYEFMF